MKKNYTLKLLLEEMTEQLGNIPERKSETEFFLAHLYQCNRLELYLRLSKKVNPDKIILCEKFIEQRKKRIPLPFILGETEFMGLEFLIEPGVFIPRPETEILVEETIKAVNSLKLKVKSEREINILDLGTGSGNIAISLAKYLPEARIVATDISPKALEIAQKNALLNKLTERITFLEGDLFQVFLSPYPRLPNPCLFDIIVSNPPYIAESDSVNLEKELFYEPEEALFAQNDGLEYYEKIVPQAKKFLQPEGYLILEIGYGQKDKVEGIFFSSGYREIKIVKDYSGIERVIVGRRIG